LEGKDEPKGWNKSGKLKELWREMIFQIVGAANSKEEPRFIVERISENGRC